MQTLLLPPQVEDTPSNRKTERSRRGAADRRPDHSSQIPRTLRLLSRYDYSQPRDPHAESKFEMTSETLLESTVSPKVHESGREYAEFLAGSLANSEEQSARLPYSARPS